MGKHMGKREGAPCLRCGGTKFYNCDGNCVGCKLARNKKLKVARLRALGREEEALQLESRKARQGSIYQGTICAKKHDGRRYVGNGTCVQCSSEKAKELYNSKGKQNTSTDVDETIISGPCSVCGCTLRYASTRQCVVTPLHARMITGNGSSDHAYENRQERPSL